jgi:hypothetical protein
MNNIRRPCFKMFVRIRAFGSDNSADFPANSAGKRNFDELNEAISMMEAGGAGQASGLTKQATSNKATARGELG